MENNTRDRQPLALIADDDGNFRFLARTALERSGFAVEEAEDGNRAVAAFERLQPDIILLDIKMPELDGFSACHAIRKLPGGARAPILMITGLDDIESINRAYDVGATDFITKPINWLILGLRVSFMLRANQALIEAIKSEYHDNAFFDSFPDSEERNGEEAALDPEVLQNIRTLEKEIGKKILPKVAQTYLDDSPGIIQNMKAAIASGNLTLIHDYAFQFKSKSEIIGAMRLISLCKELDNVNRRGSLETAEEVILEIETEFERLKKTLRDLLA
ncbi:MAG: response regulator [Candidatus Omnitrophota bacterium]